MSTLSTQFKSGNQLSSLSIAIWRTSQAVVWLIGATIFFCLVFFPPTGVLLFWNILIPIAPALIVVAVGLWRNVCPLATTTLLPRHLGLSKGKKMSEVLQGKLGLVAAIALFVIVPLRHAVFNVNGQATAVLLFAAATIGVTMGFFYEWKSAWCSTLCPVHPVEKLYGSNVLCALPNAHCSQCMMCTIPCPDSTPNIQANSSQKTSYHRISGVLVIGGLPGFIWGWFHVPDHNSILAASAIIDVYKMPLAGLMTTLVLYWLLTKLVIRKYDKILTAIFAASAVSCYYWYRIPMLVGFGKYEGDGLLVNLSNNMPYWGIILTITSTTAFFFWWIVIRKPNGSSWVIRPVYAEKTL
ncbi:MAG: hypothetical protein AABY93_03845 [Bacteroidota bacterium]